MCIRKPVRITGTAEYLVPPQYSVTNGTPPPPLPISKLLRGPGLAGSSSAGGVISKLVTFADMVTV